MARDTSKVKLLAERCRQVLWTDLDEFLLKIDRYIKGEHDAPYIPDGASKEYELLVERATTNWIPLLVKAPSQELVVDGFRSSRLGPGTSADGVQAALESVGSREWAHWQESNMDAKHQVIQDAAIGYGASYMVTTRDRRGRLRTRGLSPMTTTAIFDDPANDDNPIAALHFYKMPRPQPNGIEQGEAYFWDRYKEYKMLATRKDGVWTWRILDAFDHATPGECPVTRLAAEIDLDGRCTGVVWPIIPIQDRINQTTMDLLVGQTFTVHQIRTITGLEAPVRRDPVTGEPVLDKDGNTIPDPLIVSASRIMWAEDENVKFGTLPGGELTGFIDASNLAVKHLSAITQTPPHYLLGEIANLSADALRAAKVALSRKVDSYKQSFGEAYERVFRLVALAEGDMVGYEDFSGETIWRDMDSQAISRVADALSKLRDGLDIPARGLWSMVPGVTPTILSEWAQLADEENLEKRMFDAMERSGQTDFAASAPRDTEVTDDGNFQGETAE